jgi:putative FmdB family regulatory protein
MPTYDYVCDACGHEFEHFQSMTDKRLLKCPKCAKKKLVRKVGSGGGVIFKGSGFYETDYKRAASKGADAVSAKASESESKSTDASTASEPAAKSEPTTKKDAPAAAPTAPASAKKAAPGTCAAAAASEKKSKK